MFIFEITLALASLRTINKIASCTAQARRRAAKTYLDHLGVEALAHLGPAVGEEDRAVGVDQHQRARLVQEAGGVERDAVHERGGRQSPLAVLVLAVGREVAIMSYRTVLAYTVDTNNTLHIYCH